MKKRKPSHQREKILALIRESDQHPTADWIYTRLKPEIPKLSLGTVYRNVNTLVREGEISALMVDNMVHYDAKTEPHFHFICQSCGSIYDLDRENLDRQIVEFATRLPHRVLEYSLTFRGICRECLEPKH